MGGALAREGQGKSQAREGRLPRSLSPRWPRSAPLRWHPLTGNGGQQRQQGQQQQEWNPHRPSVGPVPRKGVFTRLEGAALSAREGWGGPWLQAGHLSKEGARRGRKPGRVRGWQQGAQPAGGGAGSVPSKASTDGSPSAPPPMGKPSANAPRPPCWDRRCCNGRGGSSPTFSPGAESQVCPFDPKQPPCQVD